MACFEKIEKELKGMGQSVSKKAKDVTQITKLSNKISEDNKLIATAYSELGKLYFESRYLGKALDEIKKEYDEAGAEDAEKALLEKAVWIKEAMDDIAECEAAIDNLKGIRKCPDCGKEVAKDSVYCNYCGVKLPEPVIEEAVEEEDDSNKCPGCGWEITDDSIFCPKCGCKLGTDGVEEASEEVKDDTEEAETEDKAEE